MKTLWNAVDGQKMYLTGFGMIVYAVLGQVLGLHDGQRTAELVFAGLGVVGLKSALRKLE